MKPWKYALCIATVLSCSANHILGAGLTISPSVVTNDGFGQITLAISGLSVGQTVIVDKYIDYNGNGVIDPASESLVQSFSVSDGRLPFIGGVRNSSVPGDDDGLTNGQIQVNLAFPGPNSTLDRIAAQYLFRLSDPLGIFSPVTNSMTVVQKTYAQGVTGRVFDLAGQPIGNGPVVYIPPSQSGGGGTVSDADGNFTLYVPAGDYFVMPVKPGFIVDQNMAPLTVVSNTFVTKNCTNISGSRTLAGRLSDSASGTGLAGLFVQGETMNGLFALAFTDTSGTYTLPATPEPWRVKVGSDSGLSLLGYVLLGGKISVDATSGSVSNVNFQFPKATALIYGTVRDNLSNAIPGLHITAQDGSFSYEASALTDVSGRYSLGVFAGNWFARPQNSDASALGLIGDGISVTVTNGQAAQEDISVQRVTAHLRGRIVDNSGSPVSDLELNAGRVTGPYQSTTVLYQRTASDGTFDLGVFGGDWFINLECSSATDRGLVGPSLNLTVVDGVDQNGLVLVARRATNLIMITIQDNNASAVSAAAYANQTINGTNYNACSSFDNQGHQIIAVCPGTWQVGLSGDFSARNYDNPRTQTVSVPGSGLNLSFTLYPVGQSPAVLFFSSFVNGHFQLTLDGVPDAKYRIEYTTNLVSWIPLRTNTAFGGTFQFEDAGSSSSGARFYRTLRVP